MSRGFNKKAKKINGSGQITKIWIVNLIVGWVNCVLIGSYFNELKDIYGGQLLGCFIIFFVVQMVVAILSNRFVGLFSKVCLIIGIFSLVTNSFISVLFLNGLLSGGIGSNLSIVPFWSVIGKITKFNVVDPMNPTVDEIAATVDRLLIEFDLRRWCSPEGYEYTRNRLIKHYVSLEQTRDELIWLKEDIFRKFGVTIDQICVQRRYLPMTHGEKRFLMDNFTTWERTIENMQAYDRARRRWTGRHW